MTGPIEDLEQELTALLEERATGFDESIPPLALLVAEGNAAARRRRRSRAWIAVGAAAAVAAVVGLPALLLQGHDHAAPLPPTTSRSAASGSGVPSAPTTLPYLDGKVVHIGGRTITLDGRPSSFISHGDTTFFWDMRTERSWRVFATDGSVEQFGPDSGTKERPWDGWHGEALSADGRTIAVMTHPTQSTSRITLYDTGGQEETAHVDVDEGFSNWTGGGDSVVLQKVTDTGQVVWYTSDRHGMAWWVWSSPLKHPVRLTPGLEVEDDGSIPDGPPNGVIAAGRKVVTFSPSGQMQPVSGLPVGFDPRNARWSPSGAVVAVDNAGAPEIVDLDGGSEPIRPPAGYTVLQWFGFESDSYVIGAAAVDHRPASLVRCATDRSACAAIGELPTGWESWKWATSPPSSVSTGAAGDSSAASDLP